MQKYVLIGLGIVMAVSLTACKKEQTNTIDKIDSVNNELNQGSNEYTDISNKWETGKEFLKTMVVEANGKSVNLPCKISDLKDVGLTFRQPKRDNSNVEDRTYYIPYNQVGFGKADWQTNQAYSKEYNGVLIDGKNYSNENVSFEDLTVTRLSSNSENISIVGITPQKTTKQEVESIFGESQRKGFPDEGYYTTEYDFNNKCMLGDNVYIKYYYLSIDYDNNDIVTGITIKYVEN